MNRLLRLLAILSYFLFASGDVLAKSYNHPPPYPQLDVPAIDFDEPAKLLKQKMSMIRAFMQSTSERDPATVLRFLQDEVVEHFDLEKMAQWIARPAYSKMGIQDRVNFQNRLKEKMFAVISRQLGIFSHQELRLNFFPPKRIGPADVAVVARIFHPRQPPIRMAFKFHHLENEGWRVFDVSINGMSALAFYRKYYQQGYSQYGPQAFLR